MATQTKEISFDELLKLVASGKATAAQKLQLSQMLARSGAEEEKAEREKKFQQVKKLMEELEITADEMIKALQKPAEMIFEWNGHVRYEGERGKLPAWTAELKAQLPQADAEKFAKNAKGMEFVKNLYAK